jgi:HEAT repeat protein
VVRRGRPPALPEDLTPFDAPTVDLRARAAWLLRVSRLLSPDDDARRLRTFAAQATDDGPSLDPARISRMETGAAPVTLPAITAYEDVLHLPSGTMRSVLQLLGQSLPGARSPVLARPRSYDDLGLVQRRLDRVYANVQGGRARGGDWLDLTDLLTKQPAMLLPTAVLDDLTYRLVGEMALSVGSAFTSRFQALRTMVVTPALSRSVTRGVTALVDEPGVGPVIDVLTLLGETDSVANVRQLVTMLGTRTGSVRNGAAHALLNLIVMSTLPATEVASLERTMVELLGSGDDEARDAALLLYRRLPRESARRVRARLGGPPVEAAPVRSSPASLERRHRDHAVVRPLARHALEGTPLDEDPLLLRLLREVVFSERLERRHESSMLLMASPFRRRLAEALLLRIPREPDPAVRSAFSVLLGYLAGSTHVPTLVGWLTSPEAELRATALRALAHAGTVPTDFDLPGLVEDAEMPDSSLLYLAGMTGHPALEALAADRGRGHEFRQQAGWWLSAGPRVLDDRQAG